MTRVIQKTALKTRILRKLRLYHIVPLFALMLALGGLVSAPAHANSIPGVEAALDATVVIYSDDMDETFLGSGFFYQDDGEILTNAHVVTGRGSVQVITRDGQRLTAQVLARDDTRDVALLRLTSGQAPAGLWLADGAVSVGDDVFALGAPLEIAFTVTRGMISALGRQVDAAVPIAMIQHDAAVNPGSSGGPLIDAQGRLIGMNSQIADGSRLYAGISYAISGADLDRLVAQMRDGSLRDVPDLGLRLRPVDRKISGALGLKDDTGLLVDWVSPGGAADRAGLEAGDIVLVFDEEAISSAGSLAFALDSRATDTPELTIWRAGQTLTVTLDFTPKPSRLGAFTGSIAEGSRIASYDLSALGVTMTEGTLIVESMMPTSPAYLAGLSEGDEILTINGQTITAAELAAYQITAPVLLLVKRQTGETTHVVVDPWSGQRSMRPIGGANVLDPEVVLF